MATTRLNKYLSECGIASRRKSEEFILQGRVSVNREICMELSMKVDPAKDEIRVDGELVKGDDKVYFILNKPKGVITSTEDDQKRSTVIDLINTNRAIFPVGRLDYNTTGVLILTNDGEFSNYITHPSNKFPREYIATLHKPLAEEDREQLKRNIVLDGRKSRFTEVDFPVRKTFKVVRVVTEEGRNHFVKRMFSSLGYTVQQLHRRSFAGITADDLVPGKYKKVQLEDIKLAIKKIV